MKDKKYQHHKEQMKAVTTGCEKVHEVIEIISQIGTEAAKF